MWQSIPAEAVGTALLCVALAWTGGYAAGLWVTWSLVRESFDHGFLAGVEVASRRGAATPPPGWRVGRGADTAEGD